MSIRVFGITITREPIPANLMAIVNALVNAQMRSSLRDEAMTKTEIETLRSFIHQPKDETPTYQRGYEAWRRSRRPWNRLAVFIKSLVPSKPAPPDGVMDYSLEPFDARYPGRGKKSQAAKVELPPEPAPLFTESNWAEMAVEAERTPLWACAGAREPLS